LGKIGKAHPSNPVCARNPDALVRRYSWFNCQRLVTPPRVAVTVRLQIVADVPEAAVIVRMALPVPGDWARHCERLGEFSTIASNRLQVSLYRSDYRNYWEER